MDGQNPSFHLAVLLAGLHGGKRVGGESQERFSSIVTTSIRALAWIHAGIEFV